MHINERPIEVEANLILYNRVDILSTNYFIEYRCFYLFLYISNSKIVKIQFCNNSFIQLFL